MCPTGNAAFLAQLPLQSWHGQGGGGAARFTKGFGCCSSEQRCAHVGSRGAIPCWCALGIGSTCAKSHGAESSAALSPSRAGSLCWRAGTEQSLQPPRSVGLVGGTKEKKRCFEDSPGSRLSSWGLWGMLDPMHLFIHRSLYARGLTVFPGD